MLLELNLVKNRDIFTPMFTSIARGRKAVTTGDEALAAMCKFISANIATFDAALADKALVTKLQGLSSMTVNEFYSLKYVLANAGIDLLMYFVADEEVNGDEIPQGMMEYNVVDYNDVQFGFIPVASKINASTESMNMSQVYQRIIDMFGFFQTELTSDYINPLKTNLDLLKRTEEAMGVSPTNITSYINSVLEYLNKELVLITTD